MESSLINPNKSKALSLTWCTLRLNAEYVPAKKCNKHVLGSFRQLYEILRHIISRIQICQFVMFEMGKNKKNRKN
jgi:hypothetical protein